MFDIHFLSPDRELFKSGGIPQYKQMQVGRQFSLLYMGKARVLSLRLKKPSSSYIGIVGAAECLF
jgi:hypothetical protein